MIVIRIRPGNSTRTLNIDHQKLFGYLCLMFVICFNEWTYIWFFKNTKPVFDQMVTPILVTDYSVLSIGILLVLLPPVTLCRKVSRWLTERLVVLMIALALLLIIPAFSDDTINLHIAMLFLMVLGLTASLLTRLRGYKLSLLIFVLFGLAVEIGFAVHEKTGCACTRLKFQTERFMYETDLRLGYKAIPGLETTESYYWEIGKRREYMARNVFYQIDWKRRRWCGWRPSEAERHALFFGGSFTFGHAIPCGKNLPSSFQLISGNQYAAYNYGLGGWGTAQMYYVLKNPGYFSDIRQTSGIAVYSFIPDHLYRNVGSYYHMSTTAREFPLFRLNPDGSLGVPFRYYEKKSLYYLSNIYNAVVRSSPTARYLVWNHYRFHTVKELDAVKVTLKLILESKKSYDVMFDGNFYVVIWPRHTMRRDAFEFFVSRLESSGIQVLQVPDLPKGVPSQVHPFDHHPSAEEYQWVALHLWNTVARSGPALIPDEPE
ncbi:hypothetical protein JXA40_10915 [bacterium]|nr:hypothetical protein [candidate division CSSED10-310 bacterium]